MYLLAKAAAFLLRLIPARVAGWLGTLAGLAWYHLVPIRRGVAIDNVAACITGGDRRAAGAIVRRSFQHLCRWSMQFAVSDAAGKQAVHVEGEALLKAALAAGKGAIVATAHTGNWDLNERMGPVIGIPLHVPSRRIRQKGLQRFWEEMRAGRGNVYLRHDTAVTELLRILRTGGCLALVFDQNMPPKRGVRVPLFGRDCSTAFAPAVLHFRTGAPVFPTFGGIEPDGRYVVHILPPVDVPSTGDLRKDAAVMMTGLNHLLEDWIRAHPDQWLWLHRRWKLEVST